MMQTHRTLSKSLAVCLTLLMMVSMLVTTAFAIDDTDKGTITVSGVEENVAVTAYRLMDVNYNYTADQPQEPVYTWTTDVADWVRANFSAYIGAAGDNTVQPAFHEDADANDIAAFYDKLAAGIKSGTPSIADENKSNRTGNGDIEGLTMGNYLILIENGMRVYRPSAVNLVPEWDENDNVWKMTTPKVEVKSSELTITKTVNDKEADSANIGDTVSFDITAAVPQFPDEALATNYAISDTLPNSLTLTAASIEVYGVRGEEETLLTLDNEYSQGTERPNAGGTSTFTLTFDYAKISGYEAIHITYTATLNGSAELGATGNVNNAYLDYTNDPYTETSWNSQTDTATVYTYGLEISKVDSENEDTYLSGAEFALYTSLQDAQDGRNPVSFVLESEGVYRKALESETGTTTLTVGSNGDLRGKLTLKGLDEATWYLVEIKAPDGYNILEAPEPIEITDLKGGVLDGKVTDADIASGLVPRTVKNDDGFRLPTTGGMGTILFTAVGVVLMGAAVILFIVVRRKKKAED